VAATDARNSVLTALQRTSLGIGLALFLLASLFPPWVYTLQRPGIRVAHRNAGYRLIFTPPAPKRESMLYGVALDVQRLVVEYLVVGVGSAAFFFAGSRKRNHGAA
jgi:hypothetical protein